MADPQLILQGEETRLRLLDFLIETARKHLAPPTFREISTGIGISSHEQIQAHLRKLAEQGFIALQPGVARGIAVLPKGYRHRR